MPRVAPAEQGSLLVESLVASVVITVAMLGAIASVNIASEQRNRAGELNRLDAAIDADLAAIEDRAADLTCCSGECTLGIPTGATAGPTSPCATTQRRNVRYFFPQIDDPATPIIEPTAVDDICRDDSIISEAVLEQFNAIPVHPDLKAAGGERQPISRLNSVYPELGNPHILVVKYKDRNAADPSTYLRKARVVPPMVAFCP